MNQFKIGIFGFAALFIFAVSADAQTRRKPAPKPTPPRVTVDPIVSSAKQKVTNQLHNVNVFVEKIGPIAVALENADRDAAAGRLKREDMAANEKNKQSTIAAIRVLRAALVALESDFRTRPQLAPYLSKLQGISQLAAESEDSAIAGKFVAAKDPLREVGLKLNDTVLTMPGPVSGGVPAAPVRTGSTSVPSSNAQSSRTVSTSGEPMMGMTPDQVLGTSWGNPSSKRSSKTANATTEVWIYSGKGTIYFYNGKVSQIVR